MTRIASQRCYVNFMKYFDWKYQFPELPCTYVTFFISFKPQNFSRIILYFIEVEKISLKKRFYDKRTFFCILFIFFLSMTKISMEHIQLERLYLLFIQSQHRIIHPFWSSFIWIFHKSKCVTFPRRILLCWRAQLQYFHLMYIHVTPLRANIRRMNAPYISPKNSYIK